MVNNITLFFSKKILYTIFAVAISAASIAYWYIHIPYISTDDAYINANVVNIAARLTGQVEKLYVDNNQYVHAKDILFSLDPKNYQLQLEESKAALSFSEEKLKIASLTAERTLALVAKGSISPQEGDIAIANYNAQIADRDKLKASVEISKLDLEYMHVSAPVSGWITNMKLQSGDSVSANEALFALVSDEKFWVDANFKETELEDIVIGQAVDIHVDMYPNYLFKGHVESFSSGTGNAFSLLEPENATGNWVKVTQRVPVRIIIDNTNTAYPLRLNSSVTVKVYLKATKHALFN